MQYDPVVLDNENKTLLDLLLTQKEYLIEKRCLVLAPRRSGKTYAASYLSSCGFKVLDDPILSSLEAHDDGQPILVLITCSNNETQSALEKHNLEVMDLTPRYLLSKPF